MKIFALHPTLLQPAAPNLRFDRRATVLLHSFYEPSSSLLFQRKAAFTLLITLLLTLQAYADGVIRGQITNGQNNPIPYATIFVKELSLGATSNSEGNYELQLPTGMYHLQFRSLGYVEKNIVIHIETQTYEENIRMEDQVFQLREIRVFAGGEDPAYPIMRRAISMAPYYMNQVYCYKADIYVKGTAKLEKIPKILRKSLKMDVNGNSIKEGELFMGENFSEIEFEAPNIYRQKIISSNMSMMDNSTQTFDVGLITSSAYAPEMDYLIMPLSPQAFAHYNFKYESSFSEGKYLINKIRITPKRKSKMLFSGHVCIVDGLWCFHSLDLNTEQIFGKIAAKIQFAELKELVWLPISHAISIDGKMMGIKGKANYTSSVKYRAITLNDKLNIPPVLTEFITEQKVEEDKAQQQKTKRQQQIETIIAKEDLSNRDAIKLSNLMEKEARDLRKDIRGKEPLEIQETYKMEKSDSATRYNAEYWNSIRPNPLTMEEKLSLQKNDSLVSLKAEKTDTTVVKKQKNTMSKVLYGHRFRWHGDSISLRYGGLISLEQLSFNAVEGFKYKQEFSYTQKFANHKQLNSTVTLGYSFHRNELQWSLNNRFQYSPMHPGYLSVNAGMNIADYQENKSISPFMNSVYSLFLKENYARFFQQKFVSIENTKEIANGLEIKTGMGYYVREHPENVTNFSFLNREKTFQPNNITFFDRTSPMLTSNVSTILTVAARYIPNRRYRIRQGRKIPDRSDWPAFTLTYKKGLEGILGSDTNWDNLELKVEQRIKTGTGSHFQYHILGMMFLNNKNVSFAYYSHIRTTNIPIEIRGNVNQFRLLPYYWHSTDMSCLEAQFNYSTPYLAIKYLPWFSERMWTENLHLSYLSQPGFPNYIETGYFLSDVALMGEVGVFAGFANGHFTKMALRVTLKF